tara:strand:+ start:516 stop:1016 length:501 start_codon:yes stop_codon:yes gene_type:complete
LADYAFVRIEYIKPNQLYAKYKPDLEPYYDKYFRHEGNCLLWKNIPITLFAEDYVKMGQRVLEHLNQHPFIQYEYERYSDSPSVKNDTHKHAAANRVIKMIESVKRHGYAEGKFKDKKHVIRVYKGFESPWGNDSDGYTLISRKHRAAACVGLSLSKFKVRVHEIK